MMRTARSLAQVVYCDVKLAVTKFCSFVLLFGSPELYIIIPELFLV
jgi:hypothetical protein